MVIIVLQKIGFCPLMDFGLNLTFTHHEVFFEWSQTGHASFSMSRWLQFGYFLSILLPFWFCCTLWDFPKKVDIIIHPKTLCLLSILVLFWPYLLSIVVLFWPFLLSFMVFFIEVFCYSLVIFWCIWNFESF